MNNTTLTKHNLNRRGGFSNAPGKQIYGVGFNSVPRKGYLARVSGKITREYDHWRRMLQRCYDPIYTNKHPTYLPCSVEEGWHDCQIFAKWYHEQVRPVSSDLDKDLLFNENTIYSASTCCFIPEDINKALLTLNKSICRWHSRDNVYEFFYQQEYIGRSDSPFGYKDNCIDLRHRHFKSLADKYVSVIDGRAYRALINLRVDVDKYGILRRIA